MRVQRGFTLVEMLMVMTIIGLVFAMTLGMSATMLRSSKLRSAVRKVSSTVRLARTLAITNNAIFNLHVVNRSGTQYLAVYYFADNSQAINPVALWNDDPAATSLPYIEVSGTSITIEEPVTLTAVGELYFFPDGSGPGTGTFRYVLSHSSAGQGSVEVNGVTGNIKEKRVNP